MNTTTNERTISKARTSIVTMSLCALFAALMAVGTMIQIPFYPVSFTLQIFVMALTGLLLGPWKGAAAVVVYLLLGLAGLPVFSGFKGGIGSVLTPTFGYLLGFVAGVIVIGLIAGKSEQISFPRGLLAGLAGVGTAYILGTAYGYMILHLYMGKDTGLGYMLWNFCAIFLPGDLLKCTLAALLAKKLRPVIQKQRF